MKRVGYYFIKVWVKSALYLFFGKIKVTGLHNIPKDKPVLFLPNHQNALLDILLLVVDCNRKPYFLTRSDVFKNTFLKTIFNFFQMIPIYRIRDGRKSLKNNKEVFDICSNLLEKNEAIVIFPEANHNLKRRVRPLNKGFTRIIVNTLTKNPKLDIRLVPVGLNYKNAEIFPDQAALYYGKDIAVQEVYDAENHTSSVLQIKNKISERLKTLTTHIENEAFYDNIVGQLDMLEVEYLNPEHVNTTIRNLDAVENGKKLNSRLSFISKLFKGVFTLLNAPVLLLWRALLKPKVWEPEFMGTLRFAFALLVYPIYFIVLFAMVTLFWSSPIAIAVVSFLFVFNWLYVKAR